MAEITVAATATSLIDTSTVDQLLTVGSKAIRIYTGDATGVALSDYAPMEKGARYIFPAGLDVTAWAVDGSASVWVMDYGV